MKYLLTCVIILTIATLGCINKKSDKNPTQKTADPVPTISSIQKGKKIAMATFAALSTTLKKEMASGGVAKAVKYCNLEALPITDSLSTVHNATIRRISNKYRNPSNKPTATEQEILDSYAQQVVQGKKIGPQVIVTEGHEVFYAPIKMKALCLSCHGDKVNIPDYKTILELYPTDLATGYKLGDLRGMWSIKL